MRNLRLILLTLLMWGSIVSCKSVVENKSINQIKTELTECGSYEVKSNETTIGYAVKPFVVEVDRAKEITEFERKLRMKYKNKFNKDYRIYVFTTDIAGDTILMTLFLPSKYAENMPDYWKCQLQEVGTYPKWSEWVYYNCSQNRFKVPGDPD